MDILTILATTLLFASVGVVALVIARFIALPLTLVLVICGFGFSWLIEPLGWDTGIRAHNFQDILMSILLPILIFESAFSLDSKMLMKYLPHIFSLATVGLVLSTLFTGLMLFFGISHTGFPLVAALLAGVIVSATDPVAVVSQLKTLGSPKELNLLIEGESLFNDATAIVLFGILLGVATGAQEPTVLDGIIRFLTVLLGGVAVGTVLGGIGVFLTRIIPSNTAYLSLLTLLLAYGALYVGEHLLHVSGIVAVLAAGLIFRLGLRANKAQELDPLHQFWESMGFIANVFVFVLMGLVITLNMFTHMWLACLLAVVGTLMARVGAVYSTLGISNLIFKPKLPSTYAPVLVWGGLRGAVTIALALSLPTELPYWYTIQSIGFAVVIFTLVVQATTNPWLLRKLGLS